VAESSAVVDVVGAAEVGGCDVVGFGGCGGAAGELELAGGVEGEDGFAGGWGEWSACAGVPVH
jgi:hypothetical protein